MATPSDKLQTVLIVLAGIYVGIASLGIFFKIQQTLIGLALSVLGPIIGLGILFYVIVQWRKGGE
jgi:hypothetical protein